MKNFNKVLSLGLASAMCVSMLAGCATTEEVSTSASPSESGSDSTPVVEERTLEIAVLETAYGVPMWEEIVSTFEANTPGVTVNMTIDKNLEDVISPSMKAGEYPDFVFCSTSRVKALPETLTKENALLDITDVFDMTVPGESVTVKEKMIPGFTDTLVTNPYGDGKTYLAPMFYGPCGLFFNAGLFAEKGWEVPTTWDEMWALGDVAKAEGIALFTYPVAGYFDAFLFGLLTQVGGPDFYNKCMTYEPGIWETPEAQEVFEIVAKMATYVEPTTVANANGENFVKNQQLVLDNKALFMPNGTWITGEMKDAPRADGFEWGFTALPATTEGGDRYSFTFFEQSWIPAAATNPELAKEFLAWLYSDEAAAIFAKSGAVQPINGMSEKLEGEAKMFYSIYDTGAKATMGGFATTEPVEGVNIKNTLCVTIDSLVTGDKTVADWTAEMTVANDALRAAMK